MLFEPVDLGPLRLPNRLVMAPMGTCLDEDGDLGDAAIAYYLRRARGGVGTITVEGCLVSEETVGPEPKISHDRHLPGLTRLAGALRDAGVVAGVQLMHPGRQVIAGPTVAPSPVPLNSASPTPHALTEVEIAAIVTDYAAAARRAARAGFAFVEVHGAHGYLPSNFLSALDNRREDRWGGDLAGRARFALAVAEAIVAAVGPEVPLVWRLNGDDGRPGSFAIDDAVQVARWLADAGVAALSVSAGTWHTLDLTLAPMDVPRGHMVPYAAAIRAAVDIPVMAVGRLDDPALATRVVEDGSADLICLGRGLIAEPDWPVKVAEGRLDELRPCIACNACVDLVGRGEVARCSVNPEVGRELTWALPPAAPPRRVLVVGGGPAGLEAARIARLRGHHVTLYERDTQLGGKLEAAGLAPSKREVLRYRAHAAALVEQLGVDLHLGAEAGAATVARERPDVVLLAVGADPLLPPIPGLDAPHVHDAVALLRGTVALVPGRRVVVVGGSATACETAELLADAGATVTIVELRGNVGAGIEAITRRRMLRHLRRAGVTILTRATVVAVEPDMVIYEEPDGTRHAVETDMVALALGWRPRGAALAQQLRATGVEVHVLGDAAAPGDFVAAVNAGADAGLAA